MHIKLSDLRLYVNVIEAGSITHGANRTNISLAAASVSMKNLESTIGLPLLERHRLGVGPTEAGKLLLRHAHSLMAGVRVLEDEIAEYANELHGLVRIHTTPVGLAEFLPASLARFLELHSNVNIAVEEKRSPDTVEAVAAGSADIGVFIGETNTRGLICNPYRNDRFVVVAPSAGGPPTEGPIDFAELLDDNFFVLWDVSYVSNDFFKLLARRARKTLRQRMKLRSFDAICQLVERGVAISVIPESCARRLQRTMAIRVIQLSDSWAAVNLKICMHPSSVASIHTNGLFEFLTDSYSEHRGAVSAVAVSA